MIDYNEKLLLELAQKVSSLASNAWAQDEATVSAVYDGPPLTVDVSWGGSTIPGLPVQGGGNPQVGSLVRIHRQGSLAVYVTVQAIAPVVSGSPGATGPAGPPGPQGQAGAAGPAGAAGRGVQSLAINASNHLIVTYTDGSTSDAGALPSGGPAVTPTGLYTQYNGIPTSAGAGNHWSYDTLGPVYGAVTIQSGDVLEYDLYWEQSHSCIAVDMEFSGGSVVRSGHTDQHGISAHPSGDCSAYATGQWYARQVSLAGDAGQSVSRVSVGCDGAYDSSALVSGIVRNIRITNGGATRVVFLGPSATMPAVSNLYVAGGMGVAQRYMSQAHS